MADENNGLNSDDRANNWSKAEDVAQQTALTIGRAESLRQRQPNQESINEEIGNNLKNPETPKSIENYLSAKKASSQADKSKTEQGKEAGKEILEQVGKKVIKKHIWLWVAGLTIGNPIFWIAILIATVIIFFALAYNCYTQMGLVSSVETGFSAWWSKDPAGVLVKAATNKCFKSSGGAVGAKNAADAAIPKTDPGSSGGVTGVSGDSH
jgi:hypothetical protein